MSFFNLFKQSDINQGIQDFRNASDALLLGTTTEDGIITIARRTEEQTLLLRVNGTDRVNAGLPAYGFEIKEEL